MVTVDHKTKAMLLEALDDEYKARAIGWSSSTFGPVRPYINIVESEDTHARTLEALCGRYGIPLPADEWEAKLQTPSSVFETCRIGVQGELNNIAMYDRFLNDTDLPEVRAVFQRLQERRVRLIFLRSSAARLEREKQDRHRPGHEATTETGWWRAETIPSPSGRRQATSLLENRGTFAGAKMLLCENPLRRQPRDGRKRPSWHGAVWPGATGSRLQRLPAGKPWRHEVNDTRWAESVQRSRGVH
jgi:hypothetical protein